MKLTSSAVSKLMVGSSAATKAYLGAVEVWSASGGYTMTDADAIAYVSAVTTAGATVSDAQKEALDDFYTAEKAASRYTLLGRMYLPIWGVAAANAVCMKSLTSGSFAGSVTHAAGYVAAGNTSSGFNFGVGLTSIGASLGNAHIFTLIAQEAAWTGSSQEIIWGGANPTFARIGSSGISNFRLRLFSANFLQSVIGRGGIVSLSETSTTSRRASVRKTSGNAATTDGSTSSGAYSGSLFAMYDGSANGSNARLGAYGAGQSLSSSNQDAFTSNLKTLWERCAALTLP